MLIKLLYLDSTRFGLNPETCSGVLISPWISSEKKEEVLQKRLYTTYFKPSKRNILQVSFFLLCVQKPRLVKICCFSITLCIYAYKFTRCIFRVTNDKFGLCSCKKELKCIKTAFTRVAISASLENSRSAFDFL